MRKSYPGWAALLMLVGCGSEPLPAQGPPGRAPAVREEPAAPPVEAVPEETSSFSGCAGVAIRRSGLDETDPTCIGGVETVSAADASCQSDQDCTIFSAAGGCFGVGVSRTAADGLAPLAAQCSSAPCESSDFSDHRVACREGCCQVYEN